MDKRTITYVPNGGEPVVVPTETLRQLTVGQNVLADTEAAIIAVCRRTVSHGDGWAVWPTGAGWAACDVADTLHRESVRVGA